MADARCDELFKEKNQARDDCDVDVWVCDWPGTSNMIIAVRRTGHGSYI